MPHGLWRVFLMEPFDCVDCGQLLHTPPLILDQLFVLLVHILF